MKNLEDQFKQKPVINLVIDSEIEGMIKWMNEWMRWLVGKWIRDI